MTNRLLFLLAGTLFACAASRSAIAAEIPAHSVLTLELQNHVPLRIGQPVIAKLVYPVYSHGVLVIPKETVFTGAVTALRPDRSRRVRSRFNLDFTPFRVPVVQFTGITWSDGTSTSIETNTATNGAPIVHSARAQTGKRRSYLRQQYDAGVHLITNQIGFFSAPGRGDRLLQLLYHQLPIHPQRIESGTTWSVVTEKPLEVSQSVLPTPRDPAAAREATSKNQDAPWVIEATLDEELSSKGAKPGQSVRATIAAPVFDEDHALVIPQGATLIGAVSKAKPSHIFGRTGSLRFAFQQVLLPSGLQWSISSNLIGVDSTNPQGLDIDSEGEIEPVPEEKFLVPALLLGLAAAPLNPDPGDDDEFFKNAGASNSLGIPGFAIGVSANRPELSAGFGFYGASLAIYDRWIRRGANVVFPRYARITVEARIHILPMENGKTTSPAPVAGDVSSTE